MARLDCISEHDLKAYLVGDLTEHEADHLTRHLEQCPACDARARQLDDVADFAIRALRGSASEPEETQVRPATTPQSESGTVLSVPSPDGFTVHEELGRGAASVVYRASQQHPERVVALKYLLAGVHAAPGQKARFLAEADAIARLDHPHIVRVHAVGEHQGQLYLCLEYIAGGSLSRKTAGRPWSPRDAARLMIPLAQAVQHAHANGIVHRDLKPANILMAGEQYPKVSDFGLAQFDRPELTATGVIMGTPAYMAPEQARGNNKDVGPAADIYALGAILYELLTGRPPFQSATAVETMRQVNNEEPRPPSRWSRGLPRDLETICLKCLEKEPGRRYASAADLAEDLNRFLTGEPIRARAVGTTERVGRWIRRHPALSTAALLLIMVAVGASILSLRLNEALTTSEKEKENARLAEKLATDKLWEAYLAEARASRLTGRLGQRHHALAAIRKALELPTPPGHSVDELRNESIACLVLPDLAPTGKERPISTGTARWSLSVSSGKYACDDQEGGITVRRISDDSEIARLPGNKEPLAWGGLALSEDGHHLQQRFAGGLLRVWNLDDSAPKVKFETQTATGDCRPAFAADWQRVAFVAPDGAVVVHATNPSAGGSASRLHRFPMPLPPSDLAFSPRSNRLAVVAKNLVRIYDLATDEFQVEWMHPTTVSAIDWHPDGELLATGCDDLLIRFWDIKTGKLARQPLTGHTNRGIQLHFSHSGHYLTSGDWWGFLRLWDVHTGRQVLAAPGSSLGFGVNDKQLGVAMANNRVQVWDFAPGQGLICHTTPFVGTRHTMSHLHAGPCGRFFMAPTSEALVLRDWTSGEQLAQVKLTDARVTGVVGDKAFLTAGPRGLLYWPVAADSSTDSLTIGPPKKLLSYTMNDIYGVSSDGKMFAIPQYKKGALLWHQPNAWKKLGPREDVRYCAISSDGLWVATGNHNSHQGIGATVWDATTGQTVKDFQVGEFCHVAFSPDNRWLLTRGGGFRIWQVKTWEPGPDLKDESGGTGMFAFSPDGKVLALTGPLCQVRLLETDTGREIARLTVPEQTSVSPFCFSPDGSKLAALGGESQLIYLWDLHALRAILARDLNLDWDAPPYPPASASGRPPRISIDPGD